MCPSTCSFSYATDEAYIGLTSISIASLLTHNPGASIALFVEACRLMYRLFFKLRYKV